MSDEDKDEKVDEAEVDEAEPESDADKLRAEAELATARAALVEAKTAQTQAKMPLIDKLIMRGLLPIALAVVGPWAAYTFSVEAQAAKEKASDVQDTAKRLEDLLETQKSEWETARKRIADVERQKAEELAAMSAMVTRLSTTLRTALIHMAVAQELRVGERGALPPTLPSVTPMRPSREEAVEKVAAQMTLPDMDRGQVRALAGEAYDSITKERDGPSPEPAEPASPR